MTPEKRTFLLLKYGSEDAIINRYCAVPPEDMYLDENDMLCEYMEWYISDENPNPSLYND